MKRSHGSFYLSGPLEGCNRRAHTHAHTQGNCWQCRISCFCNNQTAGLITPTCQMPETSCCNGHNPQKEALCCLIEGKLQKNACLVLLCWMSIVGFYLGCCPPALKNTVYCFIVSPKLELFPESKSDAWNSHIYCNMRLKTFSPRNLICCSLTVVFCRGHCQVSWFDLR